MRASTALLLLGLALAAHSDTLYLKDGTQVKGRWWSLDATHVHFLVDNQLQHYARPDVSAVTFGDATLPPPPAAPTKPAAPTAAAPSPTPAPPSTPAPPPKPTPAPAKQTAAAEPPKEAQQPSRGRSSSNPPTQPSAAAPPSASPTHVSQPDKITAVYLWNGKDLTVLEKTQAAERKGFFEITGAKSPIRVEEASKMAFIVRLAKGMDPASYSLFPLVVAEGNRRTQASPNQRGGLVTWPFKIEINDNSNYMTYAFMVQDLPPGEYSFSASNSNDGYCFGVDPAGPGQ